MKCFTVLAALVASVVAESEPWLGYGYGPHHGIHAAVKTISPIGYAGHRTIHAAAPALVRAAPAVVAAPAPAIVRAAPAVHAVPAVPAVHAAPAPAIVRAAPAVATIQAVPAAVHASQYHKQDEFGNYEYGYKNPNSAKTEGGNAYTGVKGSYSYVDSYGLPQRVDYVADGLGFRASGTNFPSTPATLGLNIFRHKRSLAYAHPGYAHAGYAHAGYAHAGYAHAGYAHAPLAVGYGLPAPAINAPAYAAPVSTYGNVVSAPAAREAILTKVQLNPGHAVAYNVY